MKGEKEKNTNGGITLIALVITIIVLLILAGVSIAMLTGENGVLTKASEASLENDFASVKEGISLAVSEYNTIKIGGGNTPEFKTWLTQKGYIDENNTINTGNLLNTTLSTGKGETTSTKDVYKLEEEIETAKVASTVKVAATTTDDKTYKVMYYNEDGESREITRFSLTETAELEETNPDLFEVTDDGVIYPKEYEDYYYGDKEWEIADVVIPSVVDGKKVTKIDGNCFNGWSSVKEVYKGDGEIYRNINSIIIPEGVTEIMDTSIMYKGYYSVSFGAISGLENLKSITLPSTLKYIGESAFAGDIVLSSIELPQNLETIESYAFRDCTSITRIEIPETVISMGSGVFEGWTSEQTIKVPFKEGETPDGWDENWYDGWGQSQAKIEYAQ